MIDIFTKFINIIPIKTKTIPELLEAIKRILNKMGKPESIYTDNGGAWSLGTEIDKLVSRLVAQSFTSSQIEVPIDLRDDRIMA